MSGRSPHLAGLDFQNASSRRPSTRAASPTCTCDRLERPQEGRAAARCGQFEELRRIFGAHMRTPPAREALDELTMLVRSGKRVCLLCYERDHTHCHRSQVAQMVSEQVRTKTENLIPRLY